MSGASVTVKSLETGATRVVTSDAAGNFRQVMTTLEDPQILQLFPGNPIGFEARSDGDLEKIRSQWAAESLFDPP